MRTKMKSKGLQAADFIVANCSSDYIINKEKKPNMKREINIVTKKYLTNHSKYTWNASGLDF